MTLRETAIVKLEQLPEPLLQEISDFIDFITHKHQAKLAEYQPEDHLSEAWADWFKGVDRLEVTPTEPSIHYQQLLLNKYRKQGLEL